MGGCVSSVDEEGRLHSEAIDKQLEEDHKKYKRECKILLLGTPLTFSIPLLGLPSPGSGESGKSTIVKQMKIIHQDGFSPEELDTFRPIVYQNVLESAQAIVIHMRKIGQQCEQQNNRVSHCPLSPLLFCLAASLPTATRGKDTGLSA